MAYTYQDFENAVKKAGMTEGFSQYDMDLARQHPEVGMSLLGLKQDWQNATTDQQRALANEMANQLRSAYGSYTGGSDGMEYNPFGKQEASTSFPTSSFTPTTSNMAGSFTPTSFPASSFTPTSGVTASKSSMPEYTKSEYGQKADSVLDQLGSYGSFSYGPAPTYNNAYQQLQKQMLDEILNRPEFSWSKEEDPTWSSYKKSYLREGDRATANALGQASAASGGRASSYAINAATQAGDYYATKLNDVIPTLHQQAYDRYLNEYQMKLSDLGAVNNQEQLDYNRYLTDLGQYNTDRSQAYSQYLNEYDMLRAYLDNLNRQEDTEYSRYLDSVTRDFQERQYADQMAQQALEWQFTQQQYADKLAQQAAQWDFSQRQYADQLAQQDMAWNFSQRQYADQLAQQALQNQLAQRQYADQMTQQQLENQMALAQLGGSYGDYSGLNAMGINPNNQNIYQAALASAGRVTPVGSGTSSGGSSSSKSRSTGGTGTSAIDKFSAGDQSDAVIKELLSMGYTQADLEAAGYKGAYFKNNKSTGNQSSGGPTVDLSSVLSLGYGPISDERLDQLVASGEVEEYTEGNLIKFRKTGKKAAALNPFDIPMPKLSR